MHGKPPDFNEKVKYILKSDELKKLGVNEDLEFEYKDGAMVGKLITNGSKKGGKIEFTVNKIIVSTQFINKKQIKGQWTKDDGGKETGNITFSVEEVS